MRVRLPENLAYKILALGFAFGLHFYVASQENPAQSHTAIVPLAARSVPGSLLFDEKSAPQISVTLVGPADVLNHLPDSDVSASVDVSRGHAGRNAPTPVHVTLPPSASALSIFDVQPRAVSLTLDPKEKRAVPIRAGDPGTPPVGFLFRPAKVTPQNATIEGSQEAVASVQQVVATVDAGGAVGTVDSDYPLVALDAQGAQVNGVSVRPVTAHVLIKMVRVPSSQTLAVSYNLVGAPAYPNRVTGVEVSPPTVTVAGRPELLSRVSLVQTAPIDLSGATADVVRSVTCTVPTGLAILGTNQVTVTVHIAAPTPPAVTPAAPPAGTAPAGPNPPGPH